MFQVLFLVRFFLHKNKSWHRFEKLGKVSHTPKSKAPVELPAAIGNSADSETLAGAPRAAVAPEEEFGHQFAHHEDAYVRFVTRFDLILNVARIYFRMTVY